MAHLKKRLASGFAPIKKISTLKCRLGLKLFNSQFVRLKTSVGCIKLRCVGFDHCHWLLKVFLL